MKSNRYDRNKRQMHIFIIKNLLRNLSLKSFILIVIYQQIYIQIILIKKFIYKIFMYYNLFCFLQVKKGYK